MGFNESHLNIPSRIPDLNVIKNYDKSRNFPAIKNGTSHLGVHLRFGTISIRSLVKLALDKNKVFISELIWRDFYQMVLFHNQHSINKAIKPVYDRIEWLFDKEQFEGWCNGKTGYPMVDAGMRELNNTGFMHNRVRMVAASFLTKHLLHDWRLGEAYFAKKLLDFDLASNIGGWQWASGSGCDAAPYFRIFNPTSQFEKFDNSKAYVEKWVPELYTEEYPKPIVEHKWARERALRVYKEGLSSI
jgi:deoxyribodipyrimidine photo-lyase